MQACRDVYACLLTENVAVPDQLRTPAGVKQLTQLLKDKFATERHKELYSIKLACHWSHPRAPYSDLLGSLTTLGDVEALSHQWQGHGGDKVHNADRMLRRVGPPPFQSGLGTLYDLLDTVISNHTI